MSPTTIAIAAVAALILGGAGYLSYNGVWGESRDLDRSVRVGTYGVSGRIK
ncbi:hypothetical protein [Actibacterium mucosum]|uniref:hypothetical protein n=1 Tax=Actibacterium mucosum TaxID=1087332 RepID=UPI00146FC809|nr:hypothetical protein [Actibacterium mucosum]